ncbi:hypothetical protein TKK_0016384 [Trichogramma kaykai]|uniref:MIF4G domain-containing protein n=1 Tax=Trichogramma kaykai TaxID=54128 RepID=A0ABD2W603_9HYME
MAGIAKGRGRGFAPPVQVAPLRRPGMKQYSELVTCIENMQLKDVVTKDLLAKTVDDIIPVIEEAMTKSSLPEIMNELHERALDDRAFTIKLSTICDPKIIGITDKNSNSLRVLLLQTLQKDYEERGELKKKSEHVLRNAISLMGEVYYRYIVGGKPFEYLAAPLISYIEMLLESAEEEDIELAVREISINGKSLSLQAVPELKNLILKFKQTLIKRNLSAKSRALILLVLELENNNYEPLNAEKEEFYASELGSVYEEIRKVNKNNTSEAEVRPKKAVEKPGSYPNSYKRPTGASPQVKSASAKADPQKPETKIQEKCENEESSHSNNYKRPTPRAIRGAGAANSDNARDNRGNNTKKSPREKKDTAPNTNSKAWGHDDRFDKNYD